MSLIIYKIFYTWKIPENLTSSDFPCFLNNKSQHCYALFINGFLLEIYGSLEKMPLPYIFLPPTGYICEHYGLENHGKNFTSSNV